MVRSQWCTDHVLSCDGRIWLIDLSQGLFSCDPRLPADISQGLHFVPFPNLRQRTSTLFGPRIRRDPSTQRSIHLSDGKLRYVVITTRARVPKIKLWTLADPESHGKWTLDYEVSFEDLWADRNYERTGLPNTVPVFALVHPDDPCVVYFAQEERLFSFNLRMKMVTECAANDIGIEEASSAILLAWKLPPLLKISPGLLPCLLGH